MLVFTSIASELLTMSVLLPPSMLSFSLSAAKKVSQAFGSDRFFKQHCWKPTEAQTNSTVSAPERVGGVGRVDDRYLTV